MNRYVYRSSAEPEPRATASGEQNVISLGAVAPESGVLATMRECPAWGCEGPAPITRWGSSPPASFPLLSLLPRALPLQNSPGATSTVTQPPPSSGGSQIVSETEPSTISPAPAPVVATPTSLSLSQPGTTLDSSGASTTVASPSIMDWFTEQTLINGIPNWGLLAAAVGAFFLMKGKR